MNAPATPQQYIAEIVSTIKSTNQYEHVLHLIVDRITRLVRCQTCAIVLIDERTEYLRIDNFLGLSLTFCNKFHRTLATSAVGELLWTGNPVLIQDSSTNPDLAREVELEHPFGSCLCLQIAVDHRTLGYLHVDCREINALDETHCTLLQPFADLAGIAISKSRIFEENLRLERIDRETGLEKYGPFQERAGLSMERATQFQEPYAVALLDVDNFKSIMNTYGYDASRSVLQELGRLVRTHLRGIDAAARYGFDEVIILYANTDLEQAITLAQTLRETIEKTPLTGHHIGTTVSMGVAAYPQNGRETDDVILTAKKALFEAQRTGRNTVFSYASAWYEQEAEEAGTDF